MAQHRGLEGLQNGVSTQEGEDPPRSRDERQLRVFRADGTNEARDQMGIGIGIVLKGFEKVRFPEAGFVLDEFVQDAVFF